MMGLFKKPNRKFRQRITHTDSEEEGGNPEQIEVKKVNKQELKERLAPSGPPATSPAPSCASASALKEKEDSNPSKPSKLLSFHDEEDDGEVFKLKKSNYSRRLAKQREREKRKKESLISTKDASASDIANLSRIDPLPAELKSDPRFKNFQDASWNASKKSDDDENEEEEEEEEEEEGDDMDVESDEEKEKPNPFKDVLQSGIIPDAATIYAMKKHRQMAREMGDFIPIEDPEKDEEEKSRLIREEDHDRSDDDDDEPSRLSFTVNTGAVERQKVREAFLSLQEGGQEELENDEAAELDLWEQEQIRKGVSIAQIGTTQNPQISDSQLYGSYPPSSLRDISSSYGDGRLQSRTKMPNQALNFPKTNGTTLTTKDVKARLEERLASLKVVHIAHQEELIKCEKDFLDSSDLIKKLEVEGPEMARCFSLFQQMRGYVKDLVECLDLKVAHIDLLDGRILDLYKHRTQKLISRRQQDIRDQSDEYSMLSSEILKGVSAEFLSEKVCTDELRLRRAAEREGRRMRRRKQRDRIRIVLKHHDGMSTDDEQPDIEILKFKESREEIIKESATIFEDVVEEFGTMEGVISNFEKWKLGHISSYREAFVPLCLPKIFGVFVRHVLLDWNPLEEKKDLEKTFWYRKLLFYGCKDSTKAETIIDDPDTNLLPGIIEKIVLPKVTGFIQNVWDPLSSKQTLHIVSLIKQLNDNYPTVNGKSKQLQACLKAVSTRIYQSLDDDIFIPLYPKELLESRSLGAADFFQKQFWSSIKLLQNILSWDGIIAEQPLQDMALAALLNRYILMGLHTSIMMRDTLDKCKMIVASLPKVWFKNKKNSTLPQLKPFSSYLLKFSDSYNAQCMKRGIPDDDVKDVVKEAVQLLVTLESMDDAVTLAKKYSVSAFKT